MATSSLSPAQNDIVSLALDMIEGAGLSYVLVAARPDGSGQDIFANVSANAVRGLGRALAVSHDLEAGQVTTH